MRHLAVFILIAVLAALTVGCDVDFSVEHDPDLVESVSTNFYIYGGSWDTTVVIYDTLMVLANGDTVANDTVTYFHLENGDSAIFYIADSSYYAITEVLTSGFIPDTVLVPVVNNATIYFWADTISFRDSLSENYFGAGLWKSSGRQFYHYTTYYTEQSQNEGFGYKMTRDVWLANEPYLAVLYFKISTLNYKTAIIDTLMFTIPNTFSQLDTSIFNPNDERFRDISNSFATEEELRSLNP